jgi:hypothetical protein
VLASFWQGLRELSGASGLFFREGYGEVYLAFALAVPGFFLWKWGSRSLPKQNTDLGSSKYLGPRVREQILGDYGQHLQVNPAGLGEICDVDRLPYPKELILRACCEAIETEDDMDVQRYGAVFLGATRLADYQEGVGDKPLWALGIDPRELMRMDDSEAANLIANNPDRDRYTAMQQLADKDHGRILSSLEAAKARRRVEIPQTADFVFPE